MARAKAFNEVDVLDKAMLLFWTKGYHATSAKDLVNDLGLSRSSLYDTFGDKRTLYLKALQYYEEDVLGNIISLVIHSDDIRETLSAIFSIIIKQHTYEKAPKGCFMVNAAVELAAHDLEVAYIVSKSQRAFERALEKAFTKAKDTQKLTPNYDATYLAKFFNNVMTGLRVNVRANQNSDDFKEVINVSLSILDG